LKYIMESGDETRRLLAQERAEDARRPLLLTGLREGQRVLDAGCGPGGILETIAGMVGPTGRAVGLDLSEERLAEARRLLQHHGNVDFVRGDVRETGLEDASFDYTWSQYVFEYLPLAARQRALAEFIRVTRPGGKVVVSEIDGQGLNNWPITGVLHERSVQFTTALGRAGFDIFVGRKMFQEFRQAGLRDVRVHLLPQYVIAGTADARFLVDWETRLTTLGPLVADALGGADSYRELSRDYLGMLADPDVLKYSVLLVTEGTRP
jgi:ubiquinone/menaquinone biosynthesis C-methylase UbiE